MGGLEPPALGLEDRCSVQLSYTRVFIFHYMSSKYNAVRMIGLHIVPALSFAFAESTKHQRAVLHPEVPSIHHISKGCRGFQT
jgi:hypothetical protein